LIRARSSVCAPNIDHARDYVSRIYSAMYPGHQLDPSHVKLELAPKDDQPQDAVNPGIYGLMPEMNEP
jgi:hypothetical protein